jgi:hypothetical protein
LASLPIHPSHYLSNSVFPTYLEWNETTDFFITLALKQQNRTGYNPRPVSWSFFVLPVLQLKDLAVTNS